MYNVRHMKSWMTHKIIFTAPIKPNRFALVVTPSSYEAGGRSYATYIFLHDIPPFLRLLPYG
jgi:hypothetical protein